MPSKFFSAIFHAFQRVGEPCRKWLKRGGYAECEKGVKNTYSNTDTNWLYL
nr:MAG TPA: INO80 complex subunit Ies4 [Caudoviricetes sp.]